MQRLEVSGAVRPLEGSLGVKGLKFYNNNNNNVIIIIVIYGISVVTQWKWLFYMYTKYVIGC